MLPPLKALPVFETVARLNSFSLAAQELNVSQSAISHQIRLLENHLGETLFNRQGRHLELTKEGRHYLEVISQSLQQIAQATEQIKGRQKTQIRLAVYSSFAVHWLIPKLPNLKRLHPSLELSIEMSHGSPELSDRTADFFITVEKQKRGFVYELFYEEVLFPVCSHAFLDTLKGQLNVSSQKELADKLNTQPELLGQFPLITSSSTHEKHIEDWNHWFKSRKATLPEQTQFHRFSHLTLAYGAAKHSLGIALVNDYMMNDNLDEANLARLPCPGYKTSDLFYLAYKESRRNETAIQHLKKWLIEEARGLNI